MRGKSKARFVAFGLVMALWPAIAVSNPHDEIIDVLSALSSGHEDASVRIRVNQGTGAPIRIGERLSYRFESKRAGYLTAVHVDSQGATTLLYPRADVSISQLSANGALSLPADGDAFSLQAQPPVGRDTLFAIVTNEPLRRSEMGIESRDLVVSFEPAEGADFARRLRTVLDDRFSGDYRVAQFTQQIDGRGSVQYRSGDIVEFFGTRTRSIKPPKLDLQIQFATNSSTLDAAARRNIDEFARALENPKLRSTRFVVAGHTDDRGSAELNLDLSRRRANAVRDYLVTRGGIAPGRLEIEAHGENDPMMRDATPYARSMNRRVEFTPLR